jgi:hypothetical protein
MRSIATHRSPNRPSPPARSPRPRPSRGGWNWRPQGSRRVDRNSHTTTLFINVPSFLHSFVPSFLRSFIPSLIHSFTHSLIHSFTHSFHHSFVPSFLSKPPTQQPIARACSSLLTAPHPRPLSPSFLRGEGGQSVEGCCHHLWSAMTCHRFGFQKVLRLFHASTPTASTLLGRVGSEPRRAAGEGLFSACVS